MFIKHIFFVYLSYSATGMLGSVIKRGDLYIFYK